MATNKEIFQFEVDRHWLMLKNNEDTIFENIEIHLDSGAKFEELKENNPEFYMKLLHENSTYEKKKMIKEYFWDQIVGPLYEDTLVIMQEAGLLEEATRSFEQSYKIEQTARLILENGIFTTFGKEKKKDLINLIIESTFYPVSFQEKVNAGEITNDPLVAIIIEEASWSGFTRGLGNFVTNTARTFKSLYLLIAIFLISPATVLAGNIITQGVDKFNTGRSPGTSPSSQKSLDLLDKLSPFRWVFNFLARDQKEVFEYIKKVNDMDSPYIQEVLHQSGANSRDIVKKCWDRNKIQINAKNREEATTKEKIMHVISGRGISNMIRNPQYVTPAQLQAILKEDAADPIMQKRFYDFRVCVYDKLFEIILGYSKAIYSMDNESYEIIKAANDVHKSKNYKAFFDLRPKDDSDNAMFKVMKTLVAIDDVARGLKEKKGMLAADKYLDQFVNYLEQNIKATYKELDELASLRKYNQDRYDEEDPDEDEKAKAIREGRFNEKKSIFDV
jgi:hypothetical protein